MPQRVRIQLARLGRIVAHTEQIVDGVLIFLAAEPIMGHRRTRRHARRAAFADALIELGNHLADLIGRWLRFLLRRHFAGVDFLHYLRPNLPINAGLKIPRNFIQPQIALGFLRPVTGNAMFLEKPFERLGSVAE